MATLLLAASTAACFSEAPIDENPGSSSDGGSCTPGSLSCDCYGNGTCDPALECAPETSTCVPAGCELGEVHCLCDHGSCDEPLLCIAGMCAAPSDSSGGEGSTETFSTTNGEGSTSLADTSETGEPGSSSSDSEGSESDTASETTTGDPVDCTVLSCADCADCVAGPGEPCAAAAEMCDAAPGCSSAAACMETCGVTGLCLDNCCEGVDSSARDLALALNQCRADECASPCNDYLDPVCI